MFAVAERNAAGGWREKEKVLGDMLPVCIRKVLTLVMGAERRESRQGMTLSDQV